MNKDKPKATLLRVEFEDGSFYEGVGKQAADAWDWYEECQIFCCVTRNWKYQGEPLTFNKPENV